MSLPNYIINMPELAEILTGFITDADSEDRMMKSKGFMLNSSADSEDILTWTPNEDIGIVGIRFGQEDIRNMGYGDNFDLTIDGMEVLSNVYHKELNEYKDFRTPRDVRAGSEIAIINRNNSGVPKEVKFDIDYILIDFEKKEIIVICIDIDTGEEIDRFILSYKPYYQGIVNPPVIESYIPMTDPKEVIVSSSSPDTQTLKFYYEKEEEPDTGLPYDWLVVLRWEGNVETDLDLYARYSNKRIYYANQEDMDFGSYGKLRRGIWLNEDHREHSNENDREDKPEVIAIYGNVANYVDITVRNFARANELTEDVTLEILRNQPNGEDLLIREFRISPDEIRGVGASVRVARINIQTEVVELL